MSETLTIDFGKPFPLFPLPNCVLLPHATVPLHIFEPRYREMVQEALADRRLLAMATFDGEDWKIDYQGQPPLRPHVCLGYIIRHERLDDGRYNILLQGVCRARIADEVPSEPYRQALLEPTEGQAPMEIDLSDQRERIESLLGDPLLKQLASVKAIHNWLSSEVPTAALIDLGIMTVSDSMEQRYLMLAESDPEHRADWLEKLLRQTRRTLRVAERFMPEELPDHLHLN